MTNTGSALQIAAELGKGLKAAGRRMMMMLWLIYVHARSSAGQSFAMHNMRTLSMKFCVQRLIPCQQALAYVDKDDLTS